MSSVKEDTIRGTKWSAIGKFSVQGINFIMGLIIARILSPSDYGIVGMLAIFIAIGQSFVDSGFSNALIRKIDRTEIDCSTVFYFNIAVGAVSYGVMYIIAPWVADFYETPILNDVLKVLGLNLFINSLAVVQIARITINIDFKTEAKASALSSLCSGIIGIVLAYSGYGVWSLVWQSVSQAIINVFSLWTFTKWKPLFVYSWKSFHNLFSYGSKILLSGLLNTVYSNMSTLVIGKFYSADDLGYYTRGVQIGMLPSHNFTAILQKVTFPIFAKLQNDDEQLIRVYRRYICLTSMCIFYCMMLMVAVSKPLIEILLTSKWLEATIYLQLFCFAQMFDHLCAINLNLLQVKGRSDLFLRLEIIKKTISFAILLASIPFGVIAICASKILYSQIAVYINTYYTGKFFNLGYTDQFKDYYIFLLYSFIACIPAYFISIVVTNIYLSLIIGSIVSLLIYYNLLRKNEHMNYIVLLFKHYLFKK